VDVAAVLERCVQPVLAVVLGPNGKQGVKLATLSVEAEVAMTQLHELHKTGEFDWRTNADGLLEYASLAVALGWRFAVKPSDVLSALHRLPSPGGLGGSAPLVSQVAGALLPVLIKRGAGFREWPDVPGRDLVNGLPSARAAADASPAASAVAPSPMAAVAPVAPETPQSLATGVPVSCAEADCDGIDVEDDIDVELEHVASLGFSAPSPAVAPNPMAVAPEAPPRLTAADLSRLALRLTDDPYWDGVDVEHMA